MHSWLRVPPNYVHTYSFKANPNRPDNGGDANVAIKARKEGKVKQRQRNKHTFWKTFEIDELVTETMLCGKTRAGALSFNIHQHPASSSRSKSRSSS